MSLAIGTLKKMTFEQMTEKFFWYYLLLIVCTVLQYWNPLSPFYLNYPKYLSWFFLLDVQLQQPQCSLDSQGRKEIQKLYLDWISE